MTRRILDAIALLATASITHHCLVLAARVYETRHCRTTEQQQQRQAVAEAVKGGA